MHLKRVAFTRWVIHRYASVLVKAFRFPRLSLLLMLLVMFGAVAVVASGMIRVNFFQGDNVQLFYVNIEMPPGTSLAETSAKLVEVESVARSVIDPTQLRASVAYAGQLFTETDTLFGDTVGQVLVSLNPKRQGDKDVLAVADDVEAVVENVSGPSVIFDVADYRWAADPAPDQYQGARQRLRRNLSSSGIFRRLHDGAPRISITSVMIIGAATRN